MSFGFSIGDFVTVIELANKIRKEFVGAPSHLGNISHEVRSLSIVLQDAEVVVSSGSELSNQQERNFEEIAGSCREVLLNLQKTLDKYDDLKAKGGDFGKRVRRVWKRLEFEPDDIRQLRERLTSNVTLLNTFTAQISSHAITTTRKGVDHLNRRQDDQDRRTILDWLTPIDYVAQQSDFITRRQAGTGQWLLDSPEFQTWLRADKQRTLFCPGIPGAGKTILTSIVVDKLTSHFGDDKTVGIAYVYCNFRRTHEQQADDLIASLLKQLSEGQPTLPAIVKSLYDKYQMKRTRPSFDEISGALQTVTSAYSKAFVIVDALDECQTTHGCRRRFLTELFELVAASGASFFATSRDIPDITEKFIGMTALEIRASPCDVRRYVNSQVSSLPSFVGRSPELQEEVATEIIKAVDGMFLLAQLHLHSLLGKRSPKAVRTALAMLPSGSEAYDQAYQTAMERVVQEQVADQADLAKDVLSWITFAQTPLTTTELQHALAVEVGTTHLDEENIPQLEDMVSVCAGLVTVDEQSNIIRLVHYTTQDYLKRKSKDWFPSAEANIARICITYLSFAEFGNGACESSDELEQRLCLNPLYIYAARNWGHHARQVSSLSGEVMGFLQCQAKVEALSQALLSELKLSEKWWKGRYKKPRPTTGLHLAAFLGVENWVKALLEKGVDADSPERYGRTPLSWAALNGHEAVVKLLLDTGMVDADSGECYGQTPLSLAAGSGHEAVVKLLIDIGNVDADARDQYGWTPLAWAARNGHEAVLKLLLNTNKVNADLRDSVGRTPLSWAAYNGYEAVVGLLLDTGMVDVDSRDTSGMTPLMEAAMSGHEVVVKLLLNTNKVNADSGDDQGRTSLSWAALNGHEAVVKLLLDTGMVDADSRDTSGMTPLMEAAMYGHEAVVKLLLDTCKVDADLRNNEGRTPLSSAVRDGNEAIVQLLLDYATCKVDVDSRDGLGMAPLSWAATMGHEAIVKLLLEPGEVDTDSRDTKYGRTPLSWAAENGHEAIIKLLIDTGTVDTDSRDNMKRTPLWYAARFGHGTAVLLLVSNGSVDPDRKDYYGLTPFSAATRNYHTEVAKYLLDTKRVDVNSQDSFGRTPLWYARRLGHIGIEHLLIDYLERSGSSFCQNDLPTEGRPRPFDRYIGYCDICALVIQQHEEYKKCQTCRGGDIWVCLDCFELGGRCLKVDHQLVQRTR